MITDSQIINLCFWILGCYSNSWPIINSAKCKNKDEIFTKFIFGLVILIYGGVLWSCLGTPLSSIVYWSEAGKFDIWSDEKVLGAAGFIFGLFTWIYIAGNKVLTALYNSYYNLHFPKQKEDVDQK